MIISFDDTCWSHQDEDWARGLIEVLVLLAMRQQHALLADPDVMLPWCRDHLNLHVDYFRTRLASAQYRTNAITINISPTGASSVTSAPPWNLTANAARDLVNVPLRLVLENDQSDQMFVASTIPSFSNWCASGWISPAMGGGSAMEKDIAVTTTHVVARWRTFYLFDSDRLHPGELITGWGPPGGDGCQGHNFEVACADLPPARWHRLRRRSIENYLPQVVLNAANPATTSTLFSTSVGAMAHFYNLKKGLAGDGVSPPDPKKSVRASRCQGFWTSLPTAEIAALESGFGPKVSSAFQNVPAHHPWPADVIAEMDDLAAALQDAI